jgi:ribose transport system substrate-binding protein
MENMMQRFGENQIQGVYSHADDSAIGAIQVRKESGRLKKTTVVSLDGSNAAFKAIADGDLAATFVYLFCAPEGIMTAYKLAKGEQMPAEILLEGKRVTPHNVEEFLGKGFGIA